MQSENEHKRGLENNGYSDVQFLAGTRDRLRILQVLSESPHKQSKLEKKVDVHRTTLRRNLRELQERDWVTERSGKVYEITPVGRFVLSSFTDLLQDVESAAKIGSFLSKVPRKFSVDVDALSSGEIAVNGFDVPFEAVNEFTAFIENADRLRLCAPAINPKYASVLAQRASITDSEIVGPVECFETIGQAEPADFDALQRSETVRMTVIDEYPSYGICFSENRCMIIAYNDGSGIHGVVRFDDPVPGVERWMKEKYASFKRAENRIKTY
ncbi:transcriptional regulator [Haloterrigena sp. SYSU A558-1]|uniref:Transcriptional regulator n=1 Tax=Haloterrigena gelatinilytica TaxID=2741724 RepID=A0A8J8GLP8_9EURY|nr:transcriptional regulator [Haloterrigena gelatinilytica]NUB90092.1 transcriptional regulator [Haloterrigena gelatinilytica]NUC74083.1 transcriptional regulator [Haloterrigena gelatinilytica]